MERDKLLSLPPSTVRAVVIEDAVKMEFFINELTVMLLGIDRQNSMSFS